MKPKKKKQKEQQAKQKNRHWLLSIFLALHVLFIPFLYSNELLDPVLMLRFEVWGAVLLAFTAIFFIKKYRTAYDFSFIRRWIFPLFGLYLAVSLFSLTQAHLVSEGFFDILKTFFSILFLIFAVAVLSPLEKSIPLAIKLITATAIASCLIGLYQYYDFRTNLPDHPSRYSQYLKGLMANKNQYSTALFLTLPFTLYGIFRLRLVWKIITGFASLLTLFSIVLVATRSVWLAIALGGAISTVTAIMFRKKLNVDVRNNPKQKQMAVIMGVMLIISVVGGGIAGRNYLDMEWLKKRFETLTDTEQSSANKRFRVWKGTYEMGANQPVLGVGAGNWKVHMPLHYQLDETEEFQNWRRPHNDYLWIFAEKGIGGLLFYLGIFVFAIAYLFRALRQTQHASHAVFLLFLLFGLTGYLLISFFTFPYERINHQIFVLLLVAYVIIIYHQNSKVKLAEKPPLKPVYEKGFLFFAIVVLVLGLIYGSTALTMEKYSKKAILAKNQQAWPSVVRYIDKAYTPYTKLDATSAPLHWFSGLAYYKMGQTKEALADFKSAYSAQPHNPYVLTYLGALSGIEGNDTLAINYLERALEVYPSYEEALINLAAAYYTVEDYSKAHKAILRCDQRSKNPLVKRYRLAIEKKLEEHGDTIAPN